MSLQTDETHPESVQFTLSLHFTPVDYQTWCVQKAKALARLRERAG